MNSFTKKIIGLASVALVVSVMVPSMAQAVTLPKPSQSVCSMDGNKKIACMEVNAKKVPTGDTATFTGSIISAEARKSLKSWTNGDNIVCLTRGKTKPEADGSWPEQVLYGACTTVRRDGGFTINAEFGRKGTYYYGLEKGPCRSTDKDECGSSDPQLIGQINGGKALELKST